MKKIKEICEIFGISTERFYQLSAEGKVPRPEKGFIDQDQATRQYIEYLKSKIEISTSTLTEERRRKTAAEAEIKNLQLEELKGNLIRRDEVVGELVSRVVVLKGDLLSLPRRLAKYPEAKDISYKYIMQLLKTYSRPSGFFRKAKEGKEHAKSKV